VLPDGRVLLAGGYGEPGGAIGPAEFFNPANPNQLFARTGSMVTPRYGHTATTLNNGLVLIVGGLDNVGTPLSSAELYVESLNKPF
jgi:hypothetical protein